MVGRLDLSKLCICSGVRVITARSRPVPADELRPLRVVKYGALNKFTMGIPAHVASWRDSFLVCFLRCFYSTNDDVRGSLDVEHPVNDDTGEGDVEPQWEGYLRDFSMLLNLHVPATVKGDQRQRNDNGR